MKKVFLIFVMMFAISSTVFASDVKVQLNGELINFKDAQGNTVNAQIINSRTMVPMRKIFELLGADVGWNGETSTVTASKDDLKIILQIGNSNAEIVKNGVSKKIVLDSKPTIVNNRTLVPLRFVSESLDKQVGWDAENRTAIIIDYDYFMNKIKSKSNLLYDALTYASKEGTIKLTRKYIDNVNSANTDTSIVTVNYCNKNAEQDLTINFSGTSKLFSEIASEGWSNGKLKIYYDEDNIKYEVDASTGLSKIISDKLVTYDELKLVGKYDATLGDCLREILSIDAEKMDVNTFKNIKAEYEKFLGLFSFNNSGNKVIVKCSGLNYNNSNNVYIDYTAFDNIILNNEFVQIYNVLNKLIFNYDVTLDELLYDTSNIAISGSAEKTENGYHVVLDIEAVNNFGEKFIYNVDINKF